MGKKSIELMASMKDKFVDGCKAGHVEIELDDGRKVKIHAKTMLKCKDGIERTIQQAMDDGADVIV